MRIEQHVAFSKQIISTIMLGQYYLTLLVKVDDTEIKIGIFPIFLDFQSHLKLNGLDKPFSITIINIHNHFIDHNIDIHYVFDGKSVKPKACKAGQILSTIPTANAAIASQETRT